ncbi:FAD/NAD(P)-binding domain-containing protein [Aspergillus californicus]
MSDSKPVGAGIKVAIIGGGPAGLSAAIELGRLPFVDWHLYEQKPSISEIGTGITLQQNTWALLERLGASRHLHAGDFFRPTDGHDTQYRNGRTGAIYKQTYPLPIVPPHHAPCRIHRGKLQKALLRQVDMDRIRTGKKLVQVAQLSSGRLRISFEAGFTDDVDLLIGADGVRSATRAFVSPDYQTSYTGMTAYRAVVRASDAEQINGLSRAVIFWYGTDGEWVYTCPLDNNDWEITCRVREPEDNDRSSWGKEVSVTKFVDSLQGYCEPIQQLLSLVTRVKRFDYFAGNRLPNVVKHGSVTLIGDAAHPLSGAFGAGAAFAMEDAHVLAGALEWAQQTGVCLAKALQLFDDVRSAHYGSLYRTLDKIAGAHRRTIAQARSPDENITGHIENVSLDEHNWMYYHDADRALREAISRINTAQPRQKL